MSKKITIYAIVIIIVAVISAMFGSVSNKTKCMVKHCKKVKEVNYNHIDKAYCTKYLKEYGDK